MPRGREHSRLRGIILKYLFLFFSVNVLTFVRFCCKIYMYDYVLPFGGGTEVDYEAYYKRYRRNSYKEK